MPVTIHKSIYIRDKDGRITTLTETDQIAENADIIMKCDSPKCAVRHNGKPVEISWNVEQVKADANALSDDFYRIITINIDSGSEKPTVKIFCSAQCAKDYLQYEYVAPLSPREQAVLMATNQQAEIDKHKPAINVIPFKPQTETGVPPNGEPATTYQAPAKDYAAAVDPAQPGTDKTVEQCVGEQPNCNHCCEKCTEPLPELPSDVTPYDPDEVPF